MNRDEVIRSIRELADLMATFTGSREELLHLTNRMQARLNQLRALTLAGRPDLAAKQRVTA